MNFIQTLYVNKAKDPFKQRFGWAAPEYHLMSWALSCLQLHKIYKRVELYANSNAAKLLIDTLKLPYANVNVTHDNLIFPNENLWALPKIFTYSLQKDPFLHLDGDVFLFNQFPESLLKNELVAQNLEEATAYYLSTQKELINKLTYFPDCVKTDFNNALPIQAVNAGILGGTNIAFIQEYASLAFEYINRNVDHLPLINVDRFNVFFEQHLFYSLAKERNISIGLLFADIINDNEYKHLSEFHEVPCSKYYLHLLGHYKRDEYTCIQMAAKLRDLYPEYYYKIVSLFKKNDTPLSISFLYQEKHDTLDNFSSFMKNARETYYNGVYKRELNNYDIDSVQNNNEVSDLTLLQRIINNYNEKSDSFMAKGELENDFKIFSKNLHHFLNDSTKISSYWLYGRDLESTNWYCELFGNDSGLRDKIVYRCDEINIIESEFDWAGLLNKYKRVGVRYYENLELSSGHFFNLLIPEVSNNGFSIFDLDELEKLILDHLSMPLSINVLLTEMQYYAEEDVVQCHLNTYNNLIITLLKQLVVKKAIKPISNILK